MPPAPTTGDGSCRSRSASFTVAPPKGLGLLAHKPAADGIAKMIQAHVAAGALGGHGSPTISSHPKPPPVEAGEIGYLRAGPAWRLRPIGSACCSMAMGVPVSRWWPVAYAFRRVADPRAWHSPLIAARRLGRHHARICRTRAGRHQGARARLPLSWRSWGTTRSTSRFGSKPLVRWPTLARPKRADALIKVLTTPKVDANLRLEAVTALGQLAAPGAVDILVDLADRGLAVHAIGRADRRWRGPIPRCS